VTLLLLAGCANPESGTTPPAARARGAVEHQTADLGIRLLGSVGPGVEGSLVRDPGWLEYLLEITNRGTRPLTVNNVKLLSGGGRYLDSAAGYDEITAPPHAASGLAEDIAVRSAGIAAGHIIPYGGTIVGIVSGAVSASEAEKEANARTDFLLRRLKEVELAPGGRIKGSAFLPRIRDPRALVLDWSRGEVARRIEIPLPAGL
jgi:hypothetical protein